MEKGKENVLGSEEENVSFSCPDAWDARWMPVRFPFTFNSISQLEYVGVYFITS